MARRWSEQRRQDPFYRAAQREGLRSRAAFKLLELNERYRFLRPGDRVLDLGASPGGWSLVALQAVGPMGSVVSVDVRAFEPLPGAHFVRGRVGDPALRGRLGDAPFQVVLSDMSPTISGAYSTDHARSVELVREAFLLARQVLSARGTFVAKVFQGDLLPELRQELAPAFRHLSVTKPRASRETSSEMYLIGRGLERASPAEPSEPSLGKGPAVVTTAIPRAPRPPPEHPP
jgi:23S rRNA (uridine2552-2'-O)-methyltransferase